MDNSDKMIEHMKKHGPKDELGELYLFVSGEVEWQEERVYKLCDIILDSLICSSE